MLEKPRSTSLQLVKNDSGWTVCSISSGKKINHLNFLMHNLGDLATSQMRTEAREGQKATGKNQEKRTLHNRLR